MSGNWLKRYGIWEYLLFIFGGILLGRVGYEVITMEFEGVTWDVWLALLGIAAVGSLFVGRPLAILDFGRKRLGIQTKKDQ